MLYICRKGGSAMGLTLTILGCRGSFPVSGTDFTEFGGSTTAFLLDLNGNPLLIDAGSGIRNLPEQYYREKELSVLLTHFHLDHLMGLLMFRYLLDPEHTLHIYAEAETEELILAAVEQVFSPPLWPVSLQEVPADIQVHLISKQFQIGNYTIESHSGNHPGGVTVYKISGGKKSVVIASDCSFSEEIQAELTEFAEGCDCLLADGQYCEEEWEAHKAYGHSTLHTLITHHAPSHTDCFLLDSEKKLKKSFPSCSLAREGEQHNL